MRPSSGPNESAASLPWDTSSSFRKTPPTFGVGGSPIRHLRASLFPQNRRNCRIIRSLLPRVFWLPLTPIVIWASSALVIVPGALPMPTISNASVTYT